MDEEIARRRNHEIFYLGADFDLYLDNLVHNRGRFTIEQFIAALQATSTLTKLSIWFPPHEPMPGNNRHVVETLSHCIANLRRHNQNHPLRTLGIACWDQVNEGKPFLVAAKQFGIHHFVISGKQLSIQSFVEFCRDNTHLKVLEIQFTWFAEEDYTISVSPKDGPTDSSFILALDLLSVEKVYFKDSTVATRFSNFIAHMTYTALNLGEIGGAGNEPKTKIASQLIQPSVQHLTLDFGCPIEVMDVIEACATVTQIQLHNDLPPFDFRPVEVQEKLREIVTRNRNLARFVANPRAYPGDELLALMTQFDKSPTGRYMLARCLPGIPSFFKINRIATSADMCTAEAKKRKRTC
jgi:hypothetical protein